MRRRARGWAIALAAAAWLGAASLRAAPARAPATTGSAAAEDIRDIHGPIASPARSPLWPYLAGLGVTGAILAGLLLHGRRRPRLTPAERALAALDDARALAGAGARPFAFEVSEIVRRYVEASFALQAAHRTTEELLGDLMQDASPVATHRAALGDFLRACDLAKFAGWSLSAAEMSSMLDSAARFVRATSGEPTRRVEPAAHLTPTPTSPGTPA